MTMRLNATHTRARRARLRPPARREVLVLPRFVEVWLAKWVRWTRYDDYLHSLVWRSKRERALVRAGYRCQLCNAAPRRGVWMEVHHRDMKYQFQYGCEEDIDITVLCNNCHGHHHGEK